MKHKHHKRRIAGSIAALIGAAGLFIAGACGGTGGGDSSSLTAGSGGSGSNGSGSGSGSGAGGDIGLTSSSGSGNGSGAGSGGAGCGQALQAIIRDFSPTSHPDFEYTLGDDKGIVMNDLGADTKPVYAGNPSTATTNGKMYFDQWFRDTMGTNVTIPFSFMLSPGGGNIYTYDNQLFFPIDGQGLGDEGNPHNYHFTLELHTQFPYNGGEIFTFTGDDDLFTFINGKLAINLGGVHGAETGSVDLDMAAAQLGITKGNTYSLDMFFAERHTVDSHFRIDTTIGCFSPPPPPK
jgi:fibro-slime domain-containing protein